MRPKVSYTLPSPKELPETWETCPLRHNFWGDWPATRPRRPEGLQPALGAAKARTPMGFYVYLQPVVAFTHSGKFYLFLFCLELCLFFFTNAVNYSPRFWPPVDRIVISRVTCQSTERECIF